MKEKIIDLLYSMSYEDINLGIEIAKNQNVYDEIYKELRAKALYNNCYMTVSNLEKNWVVSIMNDKSIYRCLKWDSNYPCIYLYENPIK